MDEGKESTEEAQWFGTYTGKRFCYEAPTVDMVSIVDIAHALSHQPRFAGHTHWFFSVAQHSLNVSKLCEPEDALWGLLHDAAEAYLLDIPRPLKRTEFFRQYVHLEKLATQVIADKFGLSSEIPESVKDIDFRMCHTEARQLMRSADWVDENLLLPLRLERRHPEEIKCELLRRFEQLRKE